MKTIQQLAIGALFLLAQLIFSTHAHAQVCASPGLDGVTFSRNTYFPGVGTAAIGASIASIGTAREDADAATTPFAVGDLALVIQMQDALINNTNTDAYGDGTAGDPARGSTNLRSTGFYEFKRVTAVGVGSVSFDSPLANSYTTANADTATGNRRFQVVRVPQFSSLTLPAGTTVVPAWNGATGGLIALDSSGALNLNGAVIDAAGKGFRGGGAGPQVQSNGGTDYAVVAGTGTPPNTQGAAKGEGIAGTPRLIRSTATVAVTGYTALDLGASGYPSDLDYARGAPGNAGGGGTQHNSGGGGGGNAGDGGTGGRSFGFYSPTNTGPTCVTLSVSFFSCGGDGSRAVGGFGGLGIAPTAARLFLGGGGGAGENNNADDNATVPQGSGGNGGGLVFVRARTITGSGTINANGEAGQPGGRDAGGGGGAGGTVVVVTDSPAIGGLVVNTSGGVGGNTGLPLVGKETQGTGGGGGGGAFIKSTGLATTGAIGVAGGEAGLNEPVTGIFNALSASAGTGGVANVNFSGSQFPNPNSCYPQLTVAKSTITPSRSIPTDTTGQYTVRVSNAPTVGSASGVAIADLLPVPFTLASTTALTTYAGGSSGPSPAAATGTTTALIATAGGTAANSFFIPPGGIVTLTFLINLNSAPSGVYQNSATTSYSDPTRAAANGTVSPGGTYNLGSVAPGSNYNSASTTNEDITIGRFANLSVTKDDGSTALTAGSTTNYTITFANGGPSAADGALIRDVSSAGLSACNVISCTPAGIPTPAVCPSPLNNLLAPTGTNIATFPSNSSLTFVVRCGVTATGL